MGHLSRSRLRGFPSLPRGQLLLPSPHRPANADTFSSLPAGTALPLSPPCFLALSQTSFLWFSIIREIKIGWCSSGTQFSSLCTLFPQVKSPSLTFLYVSSAFCWLKCSPLASAVPPDVASTHLLTMAGTRLPLPTAPKWSASQQVSSPLLCCSDPKILEPLFHSVLSLTPHIESASHYLHSMF